MKAFDHKKMVLSSDQLEAPFPSLEMDEALRSYAKTFSSSPISEYKVGVFVETGDGTLILGTNMEFPGEHLNFSIHGEQFAIILARELGHNKIKRISTSAAPCGHCRQFMYELNDPTLEVHVAGQNPARLAELLPFAFGPEDLNVKGGALSPQNQQLGILKTQSGQWIGKSESISAIKERVRFDLRAQAVTAARRSYAPYSKVYSGVALLLEDGTVVSGSYVENAAFNPTVSPIHAALIVRRGLGLDSVPIIGASIAETGSSRKNAPSYLGSTAAVLRAIGYHGELDLLPFE